MRVLVTGGAGFIGQAVKLQLEMRGHEMVTFDYPNDVISVPQVAMGVQDADAVINLAGRLGTSETFGAEYATAKVNILGAINVADACAKAGVPMVQIGTGHKGQQNPYAITKGCAEDLLLARVRETGQRIAVVRAFHAYGPGQKAFPPHGKSTVRKIIPSFVCRALQDMDIEINGSGAQIVDLIHVDEVARILVESIGDASGEVIQAGTGVRTSVRQCAEIVRGLAGSQSRIVHLPMRPGEPEYSRVVADQPRSVLGFPYGLADTVEYYRGLLG
jgi:UDP-glucose 4-epimerase